MDHRGAAAFVAERLRAALGKDIVRVILFGSVARGDARPDSDVDLVVVSRDVRAAYRALQPIRADLIGADAPLVNIILLHPREYDDLAARRSAFYATLASEGEPLVA